MSRKPCAYGLLALARLLALSLAHRVVFDLLSTGGTFCKAAQKADGQSSKMRSSVGRHSETDSMCHTTGLRLIAGRKYRIRIDMDPGVDGDWFDKGIRADVAGFSTDTFRHYTASPLKRWWRENWFQPIARIGEVGNYEHVLQPVAPLPTVRSRAVGACGEGPLRLGRHKRPPSPASAEFKKAQLECEARQGPRPNRVLISDITADATGELFLYVNDAVLTLPGLTNVFFRNNSGTAKVTVTRIVATAVIEP